MNDVGAALFGAGVMVVVCARNSRRIGPAPKVIDWLGAIIAGLGLYLMYMSPII